MDDKKIINALELLGRRIDALAGNINCLNILLKIDNSKKDATHKNCEQTTTNTNPTTKTTTKEQKGCGNSIFVAFDSDNPEEGGDRFFCGKNGFLCSKCKQTEKMEEKK